MKTAAEGVALTPKQEAFVRAYLETGNASEAYRRAYDVAASTKAGTVEKRAAELLRHPKVAARVEAEQTKLAQRHEVTADRILGELASIAFADPGHYFEWGPKGVTVKAKDALTAEQRRVVGELSQTVTEGGGTIRVKLHDKLGALNALGKHLGFFREGADPAAAEVTRLAVTSAHLLALCADGAAKSDRNSEREIEREVNRRVAERLRALPAPAPLLPAPTVIEHEEPQEVPQHQPARAAVRWPDPPAHEPRVLSAREFADLERRGRRSARSDSEYDEFGGD